MKYVGFALFGLVLVILAFVVVGALQWRGQTASIRRLLVPAAPSVETVDFAELDDLPEPVRRYLRQALKDGQPVIRSARIRHSGQFDMGQGAPRWRRFTSDQFVVTDPIGFDWNGRIAMLPTIPARVHDAYVDGRGLLVASIGGAIPVARLGDPDTPEAVRGDLDEGELLRFLAEAVWFPTALLPSETLRWEAADERSAIVHLRDGATRIELLFRFGDDGFVESIRSEGRGRYVDGAMIPTPWEGRFWNVQERSGMQIPMQGEVSWVLPEGRRPYWRGTVDEVEYEFVKRAAVRPGQRGDRSGIE